MTTDRHLAWEGCWNARDLGGLRLRNGGETRWRTTVRMDSPERLTADAWTAMWDYGIRTMIDLRNEDEIRPDGRPDGMTTLRIPLDEGKDPDFDVEHGLSCTPLHYQPFLQHFPGNVAKVFRAIAAAEPGGLVFHCAAGRDRTGIISLVLLALADVEPEEIAADNVLSGDRLKPAWIALDLDDQTGAIDKLLAEQGTTVHQAALGALTSFDAGTYLLKAGLTTAEIATIKDRLA